VKVLKYRSGEDVVAGDSVSYHGEPGEVQFVVNGVTGDAAIDWYAERYPRGGFMITAKGFGNVFVSVDDIDEDLALVSRKIS
jgi:hypothetical protein